jgi:hypothetical protein
LGLSAVIHLLALALYPRAAEMSMPSGPPIFVPTTASRGLEGMTVIELLEVDDAAETITPLDPEVVRPVQGPTVRPGAPDVSDPVGTGLVAPGPTAAEQLRPNLQDPRLWAPLNRAFADLTTEQRLELEMAGRIEEWQDSMAAAIAAEQALTDWTTTDAQGRKWGVSPGKIHLGDVTLPLPFSFGTPIGQRDAARRAGWEWAEIERGKATGELRDSWKDRAKAIRERRDRERAQARPDTSGVRR